jgi:hypothetical protein
LEYNKTDNCILQNGGNKVLQEFRERISIRNIRQNLLLIVSSFAFLGLNLQRDPQKIIAIAVALPVVVLFFAWMPGMKRR